MDYLTTFFVLLGLNIGVLLACLAIANAINGGIDFGSGGVVTAKFSILLVLISALELIPFGVGIALPLWWGSLTYLFKLDHRVIRPMVVLFLGFSLVIQFFLIVPVLLQ